MISRTLGLVAGAVMAAGLSQFPEFSQQYLQRLGGATDEVHAIAEKFRADAQAANLTVEAALASYDDSENAFLAARGLSMREVIDRDRWLTAHMAAMSDPAGYNKLVAFAWSRDDAIARATLENYRPALPLTFEGAAYAGLGFLIGFFLFRLPAMILAPRRRSAPAQPV